MTNRIRAAIAALALTLTLAACGHGHNRIYEEPEDDDTYDEVAFTGSDY
jgi:hypothetical protein